MNQIRQPKQLFQIILILSLSLTISPLSAYNQTPDINSLGMVLNKQLLDFSLTFNKFSNTGVLAYISWNKVFTEYSSLTYKDTRLKSIVCHQIFCLLGTNTSKILKIYNTENLTRLMKSTQVFKPLLTSRSSSPAKFIVFIPSTSYFLTTYERSSNIYRWKFSDSIEYSFHSSITFGSIKHSPSSLVYIPKSRLFVYAFEDRSQFYFLDVTRMIRSSKHQLYKGSIGILQVLVFKRNYLLNANKNQISICSIDGYPSVKDYHFLNYSQQEIKALITFKSSPFFFIQTSTGIKILKLLETGEMASISQFSVEELGFSSQHQIFKFNEKISQILSLGPSLKIINEISFPYQVGFQSPTCNNDVSSSLPKYSFVSHGCSSCSEGAYFDGVYCVFPSSKLETELDLDSQTEFRGHITKLPGSGYPNPPWVFLPLIIFMFLFMICSFIYCSTSRDDENLIDQHILNTEHVGLAQPPQIPLKVKVIHNFNSSLFKKIKKLEDLENVEMAMPFKSQKNIDEDSSFKRPDSSLVIIRVPSIDIDLDIDSPKINKNKNSKLTYLSSGSTKTSLKDLSQYP